MHTEPNDIEFVPIPPRQSHPERRRNQDLNAYMKLFLLVFLVVAGICLAVTWLRPAQYQASALLRLHNTDLLQPTDETLLRDQLMVHLKRLQSQRLLSELDQQLLEQPATEGLAGTEQLDQMLSAQLIEDSLLIELQAVGDDRVQLQTVLQTWMDLYLLEYASDRSVNDATELRRVQTELEAVGQRIQSQRTALSAFREDHKIVSLERDESRTLNRMKSLGTALDSAVETRIEAEARIVAIKDGIARGKYMIRPQDQPGIDTMEARIIELQEELLEHRDQYTAEYMRFRPESVDLQHRLDMLQSSLQTKQRQSQQNYLEEAEQSLITSRESEQAIRQELEQLQRQIQAFSRHYEQYASLQRALEGMQEHEQQLRGELVRQQVRSPHEIRFQIVERPFTSAHPVSPNYWRDTAISLGIALFAAFVSVWARYRLTHRYGAARARGFYPLLSGSVAYRQLPSSEQPPLALSQQARLDYSEPEVEKLLAHADDHTALTIMLLLSGLRPSELCALRWQHIDPHSDHLTITTGARRNVDLSPPVAELCRRLSPSGAAADAPVWQDSEHRPLSIAALDAAVRYVMHQADVGQPTPTPGADAALLALRQTYVGFLLQQGPKISELGQVLGNLTPEELAEYRRRLPKGAGKSIDEINPVFPLPRFPRGSGFGQAPTQA